jgi:hypothetical protein
MNSDTRDEREWEREQRMPVPWIVKETAQLVAQGVTKRVVVASTLGIGQGQGSGH